MSREKMKIIRDARMRDRGYQVYMVCCPRCYCKLEKLLDDNAPTNCPKCRIECVSFVQWNAERQIAEIDLMPVFVFRQLLQRLGIEQINKNQIETAKVLARAIIVLDAAFECEAMDEYWDSESWTIAELQEAFTEPFRQTIPILGNVHSYDIASSYPCCTD